MTTFLPFEIVSIPQYVLYAGACVLNFLAALCMASAIKWMRETDFWIFRFVVTLAGLAYAIVIVSLFTPPQYAPPETMTDPGYSFLMFKNLFAGEATIVHQFWFWVTPILGAMLLLRQFTSMISINWMRLVSYISAPLAIWGSYITFNNQYAFSELATYYGFFAANLAAATWMISSVIMDQSRALTKRLLPLSAAIGYAGVVITAVVTMQMIAESPY